MNPEEDLYSIIEKIMQKDSRYAQEAYVFVLTALNYTMQKLKRKGHVTGQELSEGIKQFAIKEYGRLSRTVFEHWGISTTEDFGNIVFNLIEERLLGKTDNDSIDDFKGIYDFKEVFEDKYPY
ncbi:MAG: Minf_1886 family protein [Candidatus Omnitrophota bacterium]